MTTARVRHWNKLGEFFKDRRRMPGTCRKTRHASLEHANKAIEALVRSGMHRPEEGDLHGYKCERCLQFHVGHYERNP